MLLLVLAEQDVEGGRKAKHDDDEEQQVVLDVVQHLRNNAVVPAARSIFLPARPPTSEVDAVGAVQPPLLAAGAKGLYSLQNRTWRDALSDGPPFGPSCSCRLADWIEGVGAAYGPQPTAVGLHAKGE